MPEFDWGDLARDTGVEEPEWVSMELDESIEKTVSEYLHRPSKTPFDGYYHPSQLYDMCPVAEYWLRIASPSHLVEEYNPDFGMTAAAGSLAHEYFQNRVLGPAKLLWGTWECPHCGAEMDERFMPGQCSHCRCNRLQYVEPGVTSKEHRIRGHADGYIKHDSVDLLLEMKSKNPGQFKKIKAPSIRERTQAGIYMRFLGVGQCAYFYISRSTYEYKVIIQEEDTAAVDNALSQIRIVEDALADGVTPELVRSRKCSSKSVSRAVRCSFRDECWKMKV